MAASSKTLESHTTYSALLSGRGSPADRQRCVAAAWGAIEFFELSWDAHTMDTPSATSERGGVADVAPASGKMPCVRLGIARDSLDFMERRHPGSKQRALDLFAPAAREAITRDARVGWLPIEYDHYVVDGMVEVLGLDGARDCWRASVSDIVKKPLLKSFVAGMLRVIGKNRAGIIGWIPRAWPMVYRDFCTVRSPDGRTLAFHNLSPQVLAYPNYFHSWKAIFEGVLDLVELQGAVGFEVDAERQLARAEFEIRD